MRRLDLTALACLAVCLLAGACVPGSEPSHEGGGGTAGRSSAGGSSAAGMSGLGAAGGGGGFTSAASGAGSGGYAGTSVGGNKGFFPSMPGDRRLGDACDDDSDCVDELECFAKNGRTLVGASPGGGLCTRVCGSDYECRALADDAHCVSFDDDGAISICLEGCKAGVAGEPKCHERADVACGLLGLIGTNGTCQRSEDCSPGQLCSTTTEPGRCGEVVTVCLPSCGGDFACAKGTFCDFSSGLCVPEKPPGQGIGTLCDPRAEVDPCNGFCLPTTESGDEGLCSAFCTLAPGGVGCGWDGSAKAEAACLYATRLSRDVGVGDVGLCGALCDCDADCQAAEDRCVDDSNGQVVEIWGRAGYCRPLLAGESDANSISECP